MQFHVQVHVHVHVCMLYELNNNAQRLIGIETPSLNSQTQPPHHVINVTLQRHAGMC